MEGARVDVESRVVVVPFVVSMWPRMICSGQQVELEVEVVEYEAIEVVTEISEENQVLLEWRDYGNE